MKDQMQGMKMSATPAWAARTVSISSNLTAMLNMSALALATMMPANERRVLNLAGMHTTMLKC